MADEEKLQTYLRKATRELQQTRRRLAAEESKNREPIAIVGIGCRFPGGVRSPEDLWELVDSGVDVITGLPTDRGWNLADKMPGLNGGFLDDIAGFDPEFFGITPAEALAMDPQQRLLLETSWEAFESAGIDPVSAKETRTAVYAGMQFGGYPLLLGGPPPEELQDYIGFGSSSGAGSGRVAYLMGLVGAALSVDTQCTSSLVAVHLACKALRNAECTLALAGGACAMSLPGVLLDFRRRSTLAPDGRSRSFAAAANGVSLSEGAGMLLLERLSDARRNNHPVMAVIRGSAINQDGATNGMQSPRAQAQERVIRQALADARVTPESIDAVEGHGVGAKLGDGVEASALIAVYGQEHTQDKPLLLGSGKSNIGHTQTVGAIAGITKMVMAMRHQRLPRTLHVDGPTTHADWSAGTVRLLTEPEEWPRGERVRRAGISCLTLSGTNGHLILEEPPLDETAESAEAAGPMAGPVPWVVSAKTPEALRDQAAQVRNAAQADPRDVGIALHTTRPAFRYRAVVVADDREQLLAGLDAVAAGSGAPGVVRGTADSRGRTAFLFPGAGEEVHAGAGRELHEAYPAFAAALDEVCARLDTAQGAPGHPLRDLMLDPAGPLLPEPAASLARFALGVALHRLADAFGITPDQVAGTGVGEVAAVHAAGALSLEDACTLAVALARTAHVPADTGLVSARIEATEQEIAPDTAAAAGRAVVAAVDEPGATVVTGERDAVEEIAARWRSRGRTAGPLTAPRAPRPAGHLADTAKDDLRRTAAALDFREPAVPVVSCLDGTAVTLEQLGDPGHWTGHLLRPGRLLDAVRTLRDDRITRFLELGPDTTLTTLARRCAMGFGEPGRPVLCVGAMGDGGPGEVRALLTAAGTLHTDGVPVSWAPAFGDHPARRVALPTYPFQYRRYWLAPHDLPTPATAGPPAPPHPLLGAPVDLADSPGQWFTQAFGARGPGAELRQRVHGTATPTPAALVEWMLAAVRHGATGPETPCGLRDVTLHDAPVLPDGRPVTFQTVRETVDGGMRVRGLARTAGRWTPVVGAVCEERAVVHKPAPAVDPRTLCAALTEQDAGEWAARLWRDGVEPGAGSAAVTRLWCGTDDAVALVEHDEEPGGRLLAPPAFQAALEVLSVFGERRAVPVSLDRITVRGPLPAAFWAHARRHDDGSVTLELLSDAGERLVSAERVELRTVTDEETARLAAAPLHRHRLAWQPVADGDRPAAVGGTDGSWLVFGTDAVQARRWRSQLATAGLPALALVPGAVRDDEPDVLPVDPASEQDVRRLCDELARRGTAVAGLVVHADAGDDAVAAGADDDGVLDEACRLGGEGLTLLRHLLAACGDALPRVVLCSTGAAAVLPDDAPPRLPQAVLAGLAKSVMWEFPGLDCVHVDLEPGAPVPAVDTVVGRAARIGGSGHLAVRGDRWYEARLREGALPQDETVKIRSDASYLVAGGTREAAGAVADRLAELGARSVLLAGPAWDGTPPPAPRDGVEHLAVDLADPAALADLVGRIDRGLPPLRGVVHLDGPAPDAGLDGWRAAEFGAALRDAVRGPWEIHRRTRDLDFLLLSSGIASLPGRSGAAVATAADAFLEALAHQRHHEGLPAVSVGWGPWPGAAPAEAGPLAAAGVLAPRTDAVLDALCQVLAGTAPRVGLARVDWPRFLAAAGRTRPYAPLEAQADEDPDKIVGFGQGGMNVNRKK